VAEESSNENASGDNRKPEYRKMSKKERIALLEQRDAVIEELSKKLDERNGEFEKLKKLHIRLEADLINFRKRVQKEKQMLRSGAKEEVIHNFLAVKTNIDRAFAQVEGATELEGLKTGLRMVGGQLDQFLSSQGVREIGEVGACFDPNFQEAVTTVVDENVSEGTVREVVEKGYMLNDRVIIPMKCIVAVPPEKE